MKASINQDGVLTVEAETGIEAFALRVWSDRFFKLPGDPAGEPTATLITVARVCEAPRPMPSGATRFEGGQ